MMPEIIDCRIRIWQAKLARAEGKWRSRSENMSEINRMSALQECRRCQTVLIELRSIREEVEGLRTYL